MKLAEYQRAVIEASFAREPSNALFQSLGNPERFRIYRHMIRTRLNGMAHVAFARSAEALGAQLFDDCFDGYLADAPPKSGLIRDVIADFGPYVSRDRALLARGPLYLRDLLRFEESKWRLAYAPCVRPKVGVDGVRELDFEGVLVRNPVLVQLVLTYPVHTLESVPQSLEAKPCTLLMYRPDGVDEVRWYAAEPLFAAILARATNTDETLVELVRNVAAQQQRALDEELLDTLSTSLTIALQRGVLVGVRS